MSDSPYGSPPPSEDPSGQPQQPQQPQQPSYGQQPVPGQQSTPDNPYGASAYGQQPPTWPAGASAYGGAGDPDKRPGTVTAAAIISMIFSGLGLLLFGLLALALVVSRDEVTRDLQDELRTEPGMENISADDIANFGIALMIVFAVWCLIAFVLAVLTMRRSNVARILLVISAALTALISLVGVLSGVTVVTLIAAIAVIVLLFTGGAGPWFARKGADRQEQLPPGTTQPWS